MAPKQTGKKVAAAPKAAAPKKDTKKNFHDEVSHLFTKDAKNLQIGGDIQPKRDVSRFVKWPRYVRIQRQRAILKKRLKVPPAINQFSHTLDKNSAGTLLRLLAHYRPESKVEKKARLTKEAEAEVKNQAKDESKKPRFIKYGLNHVTKLVETKKAKLVVIAHDVDPIELVVWLPALCRKMDVPYCIIKGKARLGHLVYKKTASVVAVTDVRKEDQAKLDQFVANVRVQYNENTNDRRKWGGGVMGVKAQEVIRRRERIAARELAKIAK